MVIEIVNIFRQLGIKSTIDSVHRIVRKPCIARNFFAFDDFSLMSIEVEHHVPHKIKGMWLLVHARVNSFANLAIFTLCNLTCKLGPIFKTNSATIHLHVGAVQLTLYMWLLINLFFVFTMYNVHTTIFLHQSVFWKSCASLPVFKLWSRCCALV